MYEGITLRNARWADGSDGFLWWMLLGRVALAATYLIMWEGDDWMARNWKIGVDIWEIIKKSYASTGLVTSGKKTIVNMGTKRRTFLLADHFSR